MNSLLIIGLMISVTTVVTLVMLNSLLTAIEDNKEEESE